MTETNAPGGDPAASPVGCSGVSGPVEGRSVAEIRGLSADIRRIAQRDYDEDSDDGGRVQDAADELLSLLAEVEAAHRFEVSAAAESAGLANRLNGVAAERDSLRGVVQAVEAALDRIEQHAGAKYDYQVAQELRGLIPRAALAAAADAPQPKPAKFVCGECGYVWPMNLIGPPAYDERHTYESDCGGLFSLVPHFPTPCYCNSYGIRRCPEHGASAGPSPAVLPETPECEHGQTEGHWTPLRGAVPVHKTRQECWCPGPAGQAAES